MISDFYRHVIALQTQGQRLGQAAWNATEEFHPGVVEDLRGTEFDPFHRDSAVPAFFGILMDRLSGKP